MLSILGLLFNILNAVDISGSRSLITAGISGFKSIVKYISPEPTNNSTYLLNCLGAVFLITYFIGFFLPILHRGEDNDILLYIINKIIIN